MANIKHLDEAGGKKAHPADPAYWENMFAVCEFSGGKLNPMRIHPIDQRFGRPRPQRGRPVLAQGEVVDRVTAEISFTVPVQESFRLGGTRARFCSCIFTSLAGCV